LKLGHANEGLRCVCAADLVRSAKRVRHPRDQREEAIIGFASENVLPGDAEGTMQSPALDSVLDTLLLRSKLGHRFDESLVTPPYDRIFQLHRRIRSEYLAALNRECHGLDVHTCYTSSTTLNAAAIRTGSLWIAFPIGTTSILYDLFFRMLGTAVVFPECGGADPNGVPRHERVPIDSAELVAEAGNPLGLTYVPEARERLAIAEYLTLIAHDFLFAHEYQHIDGGHLHLPQNGSFAELVEFGDSPPSREHAILRHALEIDADAAGVRWSLKITMKPDRNHWRYDPVLRSQLHEPEMALRMWMFAIITLFRLAHERHVRSGISGFTNHPSPLMRLQFIQPIVDYLLSGFDIQMDPLSMFEIVFDEVQRGLCAISRRLPTRHGFGEVGSPEFRRHRNDVVSAWRSLRPTLSSIASAWGGSNAPEEYFPYITS
jgi:hypothetical protein